MNDAGGRFTFEFKVRSRGKRRCRATAVSQLTYAGAKFAEWLFHQEKATFEDAGKGT
jgi:hypothetical protein